MIRKHKLTPEKLYELFKTDYFVGEERHKWEVLVLSREKRDNEAEKKSVSQTKPCVNIKYALVIAHD